MKHGVAFRSLSRPTAHRMLMLRNMVTSLFQHEQIETTLPKAREAARLAEKMITLAKRGNKPSFDKASSFLLDKAMVPKLFTSFAKRYAGRPGGYTRIHKFMTRPQDNAPRAILELVDNPKDLRWAITSRAIGWDMLRHKLQNSNPTRILNGKEKNANTPEEAQALVSSERALSHNDKSGVLRPRTRSNLQRVLRYRDDGAVQRIGLQASIHANNLLKNRTSSNGLALLSPGQASLVSAPSSVVAKASGILGHPPKVTRRNRRSKLYKIPQKAQAK